MYKTMAGAGYIGWTITKHDQWHDQQKGTWDDDKLDVGDLRTTSDEPAGDVAFSRLAENVRAMPEGDDALDLTRMVQYCLQHAEDGWLYPRDYEELLRSIGGPAQVGKENVDSAVLKRWENKKPLLPLPASVQPLQEVEGMTDTRKKPPPPLPASFRPLQKVEGMTDTRKKPPPPLPASVQPLQEVEGMTDTRKTSSVVRGTSRKTTPKRSLPVKATTTGEKPQMSTTRSSLKDTISGPEVRDEPSEPYARAEVSVTVNGSP